MNVCCLRLDVIYDKSFVPKTANYSVYSNTPLQVYYEAFLYANLYHTINQLFKLC